MRVKSLELAISPVGSAGNLKIMVYSAAGSLICTATKACDGSGAAAFWGITDETLISPANTNLVGGTNYILAAMVDNSNWFIRALNTGGANCRYKASTYSTGPPATIPGSGTTGLTQKICIRCGVDTAPAEAAVWPVGLVPRKQRTLTRR